MHMIEALLDSPGAIFRIFSCFTFPGVIFRVAVTQLFCRLFGVPVYRIVYFRLDMPVDMPNGYVYREHRNKPYVELLISIGPFILSTLIGMLVLLPASIMLFKLGCWNQIFAYVQIWLGISLLIHAFPSRDDAEALFECILNNKDINLFAKILAAPILILFYICAAGSFFLIPLSYAIITGLLLPDIFANGYLWFSAEP